MGQPFPSILPEHDGDGAEASIYRSKLGLWKYRDFEHGPERTPETLRLADVRAALAYGRTVWRKNAEAARWYKRLWYEAGLLTPAPVACPPLPDDADQITRRVAEYFTLLLGLRRLTEPEDEPVPFSYRFAAAWCGTHAVGQGIRELRRLDFIRQVGTVVTGAGFRPMPLYALGEGRAA